MNFKVRKLHVIFIGYIKGYLVVGGYFMNNTEWVKYSKAFEVEAKKNGKSLEYITKYLKYAELLASTNLPIIFDGQHLGGLIGIKHDYLYKVVNSQKNFYRKFYIKKRNGKKRIIHEALPNLKIVQKWILENILYNIGVSKFAKAYIKGISIKDNVRFHKKQNQILKIDILDFFTSIQEKQVYRIFRKAGYSEELSVLLTKLCTINGYLPQGASTSGYLSNLVMMDFDKTLSKYCLERKIRYTRYADDLTFSGDFDYKSLFNFVKHRLKLMELDINDKKTKILKRSSSQIVTGIVLNEKIQVPKDYRRKIRLEIHYIKKYGLHQHLKKTQNKISTDNYLESLIGKVNYCLFINSNDLAMLEYKDYLHSLFLDLFSKQIN